jgi:CBS domain-containing protein
MAMAYLLCGATFAEGVRTMKARDVMVPPVITVTPNSSVRELAQALLKNRISAVPVDSQGQLVGIVSEGPAASHEIAILMEQNSIKRVPIVSKGQLVGIVSRANLIQAVASKNVGLKSNKRTQQFVISCWPI